MLYFLGQFFASLWIKLTHGFVIRGRENIPTRGGAIIVANHVSNWDPFVLGGASPRKVYFMAKKELFKFKPLAFLLQAWGAFPVERGGADRQALETALRLLRQGKLIGIFVEGGRNRTGSAGMLTPQPGAAMLALKAGVPIIPIALIGMDRLHKRPFHKVYAMIGPAIVSSGEDGSIRRHKETYQQMGLEIVREITRLKELQQWEELER
jgi:1-acyl-sn-glycerol-3-phosphate acyltransferase